MKRHAIIFVMCAILSAGSCYVGIRWERNRLQGILKMSIEMMADELDKVKPGLGGQARKQVY